MLDEAVRGSIGTLVRRRDRRRRHRSRSASPTLDLGDLPGRGPAADVLDRDRRAPDGDARRVQGPRGRQPRARRRRRGASTRELEAAARAPARAWRRPRAAAEEGDFVVVDYVGSIDGEPFEGGEGRDQLIELGSRPLLPGFEEQLTGAKAGDERTIDVTFPDDYGAEQLAGKTREFAVTVKEVKRKQLPELDDDFASDAAGFDTLDELREDIREQLARGRRAARSRPSSARPSLDAAVAEATVEVPDALVEARARELWEQHAHPLARQGISKEAYLQISGKTEEEILEEAKPDAEQALRREAVLAAVVEAEAIEPTDEDLLEALAALGRAREHHAGEAARAPARRRPPGDAARGRRHAQGDRPAGRERDSDPGRAGPGARQAVDARQGRRRGRGRGRGRQAAGQALDAGVTPEVAPRPPIGAAVKAAARAVPDRPVRIARTVAGGASLRRAVGGRTVLVAGPRTESLEATDRRLRRARAAVVRLEADLADTVALQTGMEDTLVRHGAADALVLAPTPDGDEWQAMRSGYYGAVLLILAALPGMLTRGGGQVVVLRRRGRRSAAEAGARGALDGFLACAAPELTGRA